ncbi:hypothetical protein KEM56_000663 [Ascosphaera pollenicola]|nr:hypothetical protein KEM56_000663 [Ascosphaera pollenicola]
MTARFHTPLTSRQRKPVSTRKKACKSCSDAKARCNLEKPICSRCRSQGKQCQYPFNVISAGEQQQENRGQRDTPATRTVRETGTSNGTVTDDSIIYTTSPSITTSAARTHMYDVAHTSDGSLFEAIYPGSSQNSRSATHVNAHVDGHTVPDFASAAGPTQAPAASAPEMVLPVSEPTQQQQAFPAQSFILSFQNVVLAPMPNARDIHSTGDPNSLALCDDSAMITLQEIAFRTAKAGLNCREELLRQRPSWESWIVASTKRRAIFVMYIFVSLYNAHQGMPNFVAEELKGVFVPESKKLWEATDRENWEKEYSSYQSRWGDGMLEISELWRSAETGSERLRVYATDHSANVIRTHGWRTIANSAAYLLPVLRSDMKVLDIGCGPGSITVDFAQRCPQGHVTGVEYIEDPLPDARSLAEAAGLKNVDFQTGDIHDLPFPDDTFDLVHVHQVLQHVDDPIHALKEMRRVCKPGGFVAARESDTLSWYPESEALSRWVELDVKMRADKGGHPHCGRKIHVFAKRAGFEDHKIRRSTGTWCFSSPEEREYWGGSMGGRAKASGFAEAAIKDGYATKDELEKIVDGWKKFVEDEDAWFGLMHGEVLCTK